MNRNSLMAALVALMLSVPVYDGHAASSDTYKQLNLFGDVFERVRNEYVEEVTDEQLIEYAVRGMLSALDPHSSYQNADSFQDMQIQTRGEFGGLGIEVTMENGLVKVVSPIDDTPAFEAGIATGDLITHIDGEQVLGLTLSEAVDRMRGPVNSEIVITVARQGMEQTFDVTIVRDVIRIRSVRSHAEGNIAYIRITSFNEQTTPGLQNAVEDLRGELGDDLQGFVIDLRNNPGGLLDQAISVSDAFLEQGEIVSTRGRDPENAQRYNARAGDLADGLPVVVLINGGSASASEIVAGALQDHDRAVILGTTSFGKGSVQTIIPLPGNRAMRLTTARYFTPSGKSIQATGIVPDIVVEPATVQVADAVDSTSEADLPGHLAGNDEDNGATDTDDSGPLEDYQLQRALDLIQGVALFEQRS